jgi:hypothetical protein
MFAMSASDLMVFAKMHFDGGSAPDGGRLLGEQATHAMQETQVTLPCIGTCDQAWGLGWAIYNLDGGGQVFGRDGATIGQGAFSRMAPERNLAIAVRANGGNMGNVGQEIYARVLRDLAGLETPPEAVPDPAATMPDTSRFAGKYSSEAEDNVVRVDEDGRVFIDSAPRGISAELGGQPETMDERRTLHVRRPDRPAGERVVVASHESTRHAGFVRPPPAPGVIRSARHGPAVTGLGPALPTEPFVRTDRRSSMRGCGGCHPRGSLARRLGPSDAGRNRRGCPRRHSRG